MAATGLQHPSPGVSPTGCPCCRLLVVPREILPDEDHVTVSPHVLRQTCRRQRAATTGVHDTREASGHQRTATSGTTSHPTRRRARLRWMWWQERPRLYCSTNPSYPLAATSARLARMTGALSGLPSKTRALPGMFAPTTRSWPGSGARWRPPRRRVPARPLPPRAWPQCASSPAPAASRCSRAPIRPAARSRVVLSLSC